jgi:hypothetical protein
MAIHFRKQQYNALGLHVKRPIFVLDCNKIWSSSTDLKKKVPNIKFYQKTILLPKMVVFIETCSIHCLTF